jgi:hypothetical protein
MRYPAISLSEYRKPYNTYVIKADIRVQDWNPESPKYKAEVCLIQTEYSVPYHYKT